MRRGGVSEDGEFDDTTPAPRTGRPSAPIKGHWLSVDPGEVHVGIGSWDGEDLVEAFETSPEALRIALRAIRPELVVIEAFSLRSPRWSNAQATQAVNTVKLIGAVEAILEEWGGKVVEQQPSVRHVAQASPFWKDLPEIAANSHARSAVAHGLYYIKFAKR